MTKVASSKLKRLHKALIWITEARAGSSAVILTLAWRVLVIVLNLLNGIMVVRNLGPAGRGEQSVIGFWPNILPSVLEFGIPCSLIYYARLHHEQKNEFYGAALLLGLIFSAFAVSIGIIGIPHWIARYDPLTIRTSQCFMAFAPSAMLIFFALAILDTEHNFSLSNYLRNAPTFLTTLGLVTLIVIKHVSPLTTALAYFVPNVFFLCYISTIIWRRYRPSIRNWQSTIPLLCHYGIRVYGSTLVGNFGQLIDQLLVVGLLTPIDLGIYTVALSGSRVLSIIPNSILNILLPKIIGRSPQEISRLVNHVSKMSFLGTSAAGALLAALIPYVMPRLFGHGLSPGIGVAQILIVEVVFASTTWILMQSYLALNHPAIVTLLQSISLCLCIPFMLFLIPRFGLKGAALALLLSTFLRFLSAIFGYAIILKLPLPTFIVTRDDIRFTIDFMKHNHRDTS